MCSPLTDSRWVRPLRRIASASSWSTAFWSPVTSAIAIPAEFGGSRCGDVLAKAGRARARGRAAAPASRPSPVPSVLPTAANLLEPGVAREIVGARKRHRRRRSDPCLDLDLALRARFRRASPLDRARSAPAAEASVRTARPSAGRCPWRRDNRRDSTRPATSATTGRSSRGCATHDERAHTKAQPSAAASANQPSARPARPLAEHKADQGKRRRHAQERRPLAPAVEREPRGDAAPEADDDPRRELRALGLEEPLQPLVKRGKPRLPIAPSTLWKRRFPYVRGARPLHCSNEKRGKRA